MSGKRVIITIGRQYGSGGKEIGEKLAAKLGIGFYDKNLVAEASRRTGISEEEISQGDEKAPASFLAPYPANPEDVAFFTESDVLRSLAEKESFVVVGRCANSVLKGKADTLDVFVYASRKKRMDRIAEYLGTDDEWTIRRAMERADGIRKAYYNHYSEYHWGRPEGYNLMVDRGLLGIDGTVELLADAAKAYFGI